MNLPTKEGYYWFKYKTSKWYIIQLQKNDDGVLCEKEPTPYGPLFIPIDKIVGDGDKIVGPIKEPQE